MPINVANFTRGFEKGKKPYFLAKEFFNSSLGLEIANNPKFQVCIRKNYFNIYWNGCSVLKYHPTAQKHVYCIHHEYLEIDRPSKNNPYVDLNVSYKDDKIDDLVYGKWSFLREIVGAEKGGKISAKLEKYVNGSSESSEKKNISDYIRGNNLCWLDLEIAFSRKSESKKGEGISVADRIDLAVIDSAGGKTILKFIEVKMANDARLKKHGNDFPPVCEKLEIYKKNLLEDQEEYLLKSYKRVAQNMIDFGLVHDRRDLIEGWISGGYIDRYPHLLIISANKTLAKKHREKINAWVAEFGYPDPSFVSGSVEGEN